MVNESKCNEEFKRKAGNFTAADIAGVLNDEEKGKSKAKEGVIAEMYEEICDLFAMLSAYAKGQYRDVPWKSIAAIGAALAYLICPFDIIPDFIPGIGMLDDMIVLGLCLKTVKIDLDKFRVWRNKTTESGIKQ